MLAVFRREMGAYFASPLGYVFIAVFYFFSTRASYFLPPTV